MEEIKVGEYVRLARNQGINKIIEIEDNRYILDDSIADEYGDLTCVLEKHKLKDEVLKHSENIIDLIEVGDYVDKRLVLQVDYKNKNVCLLISFTDTKANTNTMWYGQEDIKSIVTHEQFEQVEYKI